MSETVTIASDAPMSIRIHAIGDPAPVPKTVVLNGARHPDALLGRGITRNVPRGLFEAWLLSNPHLSPVLHVLTEDDVAEHSANHTSYGHQAA